MNAVPTPEGLRSPAVELALTPVTEDMRLAFQRSRESFATVTDLRLPEGWPEFPEAFTPLESPDSPAPWTGYLFSTGDQLVGNGGFTSCPDSSGTVEIGFEIAPGYRNRGYATAAARAFIEAAFEHGASRVIAHTLAERNASNSALREAGMGFAERVPEPSLGEIWRFAINWPGLA